MDISRGNFVRLFQNIDQLGTPEKTGRKKQEAGVKAYDLDKMNAVQKVFIKKMGIPFENSDGKTIYLDKTSLKKFLERNKVIASAKEFNPKDCISQLKHLYTPIAQKATAAFKGGNFRMAEDDLRAVCKALGMEDRNVETCVNILSAWGEITKAEGPTMYKAGTVKAPVDQRTFVIEKDDGTSIANDLKDFLQQNCKPDPLLKSTLDTMLLHLDVLSGRSKTS